jgi:actin-related protein
VDMVVCLFLLDISFGRQSISNVPIHYHRLTYFPFIRVAPYVLSLLSSLQNVAVLRGSSSSEADDGSAQPQRQQHDDDNNTGTQQRYNNRRQPIQKVNYDTLHRPMTGETDGDWESTNPVNLTTGLWYDGSVGRSNNSNDIDVDADNTGSDWNDLIPTFLQHGYESALGYKTTSTAPLLLIERSYNPPPIRQQLLEILMEECQVPATFFGRDATMACYACGRTTSTVVDIGYSGTTVSPVYEGYVEQKGIRRAPIGSASMDEMVVSQLQSLVKSVNGKSTSLKPLYQVQNPRAQRKDAFRRLSLLDIGKDCRESGAGQAINTAASKSLMVPSMSYSLPDGQTVDVPSQTRFAVANLVVGKAPDEDNDESDPRDEMYNKVKEGYESIIRAALNEDDDGGGGDNENSANKSNNGDDDDEEMDDKKEQASKYTDATAVGLSSRRGLKRGRKAPSNTSKSKEKTQQESNGRTKLQFDNRILQKACAPYLQSLLEQLTPSPVANMVCDAAFRCDRDQQAGVLGNVVLAGGGSCIGPTDQSVPDSLREQIEAIIHTHTPGWRVKVMSPGLQERAIASWLGGSILGSMGTFHDMWISRAEYDEWGCSIVNRKCP